MKLEYRRQVIHISGVLFVILAQFVGREIAVGYFIIFAILFLGYSIMLHREENRLLKRLNFFEPSLRKYMMRFERPEGRKFLGAFLFYLSAAITFFFFPIPLASAAVAILSVGDGFATLIGVSIGRIPLFPKKTLEGSLAFFLTATLAASFFVPVFTAAVVSLAATIIEVSVGHPTLKQYRNWGIDDNLLVPIISGLLLTLIAL